MKKWIILLITVLITGLSLSTMAQAEEPSELLGSAVYAESGDSSAAFSGCANETVSASNATLEQQVVELVNAHRATLSLPPLKRINELSLAARYHAADMGQDDYFDHDTHDRVGGNLVRISGCEFSNRITSYGYNFISAAENIAAGQTTPQQVMESWLNSDGHRENIERSGVWEIGVGYYNDRGSAAPYWVQNFGRRPASDAKAYPIVINNEAIETDSTTVSLYLYGKDDWDEYRLQNDGGDWSEWQPFTSATVSWVLANTVGERLVTVELRRNGSETRSNSDTIRLNSVVATTPTPSLTPLPSAETATPTPSLTSLPSAETATPTSTSTTPTTSAETATPTPTTTATSASGRPTVPSGSTSTPTTTATPTATTDLSTSTPGSRPTTDSGATATPFPNAAIHGTVNLQVLDDDSKVEIRVSSSECTDSVENSTVVATTNSSGFFEVSPPVGGQAYRCLYAVQANYLFGQRAIVQAGNQGMVTLPAGDMNGDNKIDIFDVAYIGQRYDTAELSADLNKDGVVNIFDVAIVSGNYQAEGPIIVWQ